MNPDDLSFSRERRDSFCNRRQDKPAAGKIQWRIVILTKGEDHAQPSVLTGNLRAGPEHLSSNRFSGKAKVVFIWSGL